MPKRKSYNVIDVSESKRNEILKGMFLLPISLCIQTGQWCKWFSSKWKQNKGCLISPSCSWVEEHEKQECLCKR